MQANDRQGKNLDLLALVISRGIVQIPAVVMGMLLIEVSSTFNISIGVAGQLRTLASFLGLIFALLIGALSVRIAYRTLLELGVIIYALSAVGCAFAPDFLILGLAFSLTGIGFALITSMATAMVGDVFPIEKRATAMGLIMAGNSFMSVIVTLVTLFAANIGGWRIAFLILGLPVPIAALFLVIRLPKSVHVEGGGSLRNILSGYLQVVMNRSALACLVGNSLSMAILTFHAVYLASFWRQNFALSLETATLLMMFVGVLSTSGAVISGRVVQLLGRKRTASVSILVFGLCTAAALETPLILSLLLIFVSQVAIGVMNSSVASLTLEQVPMYRGTLMSLLSVAANIGQMFSAVMGSILIMFNYNVLGLVLGLIGILAVSILHIFSVDPTVVNIIEDPSV